MPADGEGIYIDHGGAANFSQDMQAATQQIHSLVTNLEQEITGIVAQWLGPDREIYYGKVQPTWNNEVQALSTILNSHATTLDSISDNYQQTVTRNAQGFEEIKF